MPNKTETKALTKQARVAVNAYLQKNVITDFSQIPVHIKMTFLQETPPQFIKQRDINGTKIPYIDHFYAERALNFISNYNWGSEMIKSSIEEKKVKTKNGEKTAYEAMVEMKMWIHLGENRIERYIASGHTMYENPAITKADALQSAISKANTRFARQLGMGANVIAKENNAYAKIEDCYEDVDIIREGKDPLRRLDDEHFESFLKQSDDYIEKYKDKIQFTPEQQSKLDERMK